MPGRMADANDATPGSQPAPAPAAADVDAPAAAVRDPGPAVETSAEAAAPAPSAPAPAADAPPAPAPAAAAPPAPTPAPLPPAPTPPAPLPPAPTPARAGDDDDDGPLAWLKENPVFAAVLVLIMVGGTVLANHLRDGYLTSSFTAMQVAWEERLAGHGLPVPWLAPHDVPPPPLRGPLRRLGLQPRQDALELWAALLRGEPAGVGSLTPGLAREPLTEALLACAALREAAGAEPPRHLAKVDEARGHLELVPTGLRPPLDAAAQLVLGEAVAAEAAADRAMRDGGPPAALGALRAVRDEARRRLIEAALTGPLDAARLEAAARFGREGAPVRAALEAHGPGFAARLRDGDLAAAAGAVALFDAAWGGRGPAAAPELAAAWAPTREAVGEVLAARLRVFGDDPQPAFAVADALGRADPEAEVPASAWRGWHEHLPHVVNDPERLSAFAARFLGRGFMPPAVEEIVLRGGGAPGRPQGAPTAGAALASALAVVAAARDGADPATRDAAAAEVAARLRPLDELLAGRTDPAARRIRAQGAFLLARALLAGSGPAAAADALRALDQAAGYEPRHRLLAVRAGAERLDGAGGLTRAVATTRERVAAVDALAPRLAAGLSPDEVLAWELRGWPADAWSLGGERVGARVDLVELLLAANLVGEAVTVAAAAVPIDPDHAARACLAHARALKAAGRRADALRAARDGRARAKPEERALVKALEALAAELSRE